jgi:hypothetical protein
MLLDVMGPRDPTLSAFPEAIRALTYQDHDRWVRPLYQAHWPEAQSGRTDRKLRFLTCNLYATAPYTVLFASPRPPLVVGTARALGGALGLRPSSLARAAAAAVSLQGRLLSSDTRRRIVQIAAFIAAVDHVLDHCLGGLDAAARGLTLRALIDGSSAGAEATGPLAFLRALHDDMGRGIVGADDARVYGVATARLREYLDAEVKAMTGVPDPSGCCWRMPGVLGTIEGLVFPVWRYAGDQARDWMYSVSLFVQVMDDWLDADKDAADIRPTPILTGFWTFDTVRETWQRTLDGLVELARHSGVDDEDWLLFVKETYRMMAIETAEAMSGGGAA